MPELPEVEGFRRFFARHAAGKRVRRCWIDAGEVRQTSPASVVRALTGQVFEQPLRHGKWLVCPTRGPSLVIHFGMTGDLAWNGRAAPERHDRMTLQFADGCLHFSDMRKLGGIWLLRAGEDLARVTGELGPDALAIDRGEFVDRLRGHRGALKARLMDQSLVAGLGNLTVDATLWRAKLHPRRGVETLDARAHDALFSAMKRVLTESLPRGSTRSREDPLTDERREGARCPRCGSRMRRETVAGRTTWFCPRCQRPPRKRSP